MRHFWPRHESSAPVAIIVYCAIHFYHVYQPNALVVHKISHVKSFSFYYSYVPRWGHIKRAKRVYWQSTASF